MTLNYQAACSVAWMLLWCVAAPAAPRDQAWAPFEFLLGEWTGEGTGQPGEGSGGSVFRFELEDRILVRDNWANYPATKERPASSHKDLMVIYRESSKGPFQAIYFDNEGHVIRYAVRILEDGAVQFLSEVTAASPRFRLTYTPSGKASTGIRFEIAPPGQPDAFKVYIEAKARKKN